MWGLATTGYDPIGFRSHFAAGPKERPCRQPALTPTEDQPMSDHRAEPVPTRQGTEWTCPMHPEVRTKEPGRCPTCRMNLVKVE